MVCSNVIHEGLLLIMFWQSEPMSAAGEGTSSQVHQSADDKHKQYLGTAVDAIPIDIKLVVDKHSLPEGVAQQHVIAFCSLYKEHCEVGGIKSVRLQIVKHWLT